MQMLKVNSAKMFMDYGLVFKEHVLSHLNKEDRVDVVFDVYIANSLKSETETWFWCAPTCRSRFSYSKELEEFLEI